MRGGAVPVGRGVDACEPRFNGLSKVRCVYADAVSACPVTLNVAPAAGSKPTGRILPYTCGPGDDGRFALVEFVATDRAALDDILKETHPGVKVFRLGEQGRKAVLTELRKFRQDFDFNLDSSKCGPPLRGVSILLLGQLPIHQYDVLDALRRSLRQL